MDHLVELVLVAVGLFGIGRSLRLRMKGSFTSGRVTEANGVGRGRRIRISFKAQNKKTFFFSRGITFRRYEVGDSIPLLYDPSNPTDAVIYNFDTMWFWPLLCLGAGILIYLESTH